MKTPTMQRLTHSIVAGTLMSAVLVVTPVRAQIRDTSKVRQTPSGWVLDFQQQPLRVVINALAEAGGLNVTTANIPARNIDLRLGQGLDRAGIVQVLKGVAEANSLTMIETSSLIRIEGTPPAPTLTAAQQAAIQQAQNAPQLHTYRLRHASAVQLAPVLTALFSGMRTQPNVVLPPGVQFNIPAQPAAQPFTPAQPGRGGGAGTTPPGRGGGAGTAVPERGSVQGAAGNANTAVSNPTVAFTTTGLPAELAERVANIQQQVTQQLQQAQQRAQGGALSANAGDVRIVAEESSNSLLIRASAQDFALIQQILSTVDLRPLQVLIEVTIAEVTRTDDLNVGIAADATRTRKGASAPDAEASLPSVAGARDFVLQLTGGRGTIDFNVALNALASRGILRVLSMPVVIAQNNREAILNVGTRRPFVQVQQASGIDPNGRVQTIQYLDVGTVLTITPTINPDGYVNLQVNQTANNATNEVQFDAPVISTREATTQVFVRDGQTTVVGGLADNSNQVSKSGIPLLRDIPLLGWLFRSTQQNKATSELYLFLTPHIVTNDADLERLRDAIKNNSELLKDVPIGGRIPPRSDTLDVPPVVRPPTTRPPSNPPGGERRPPSMPDSTGNNWPFRPSPRI